MATDQVTEEIMGNNIKTLEVKRLHPDTKNINFYDMCLVNYATPISFLYRRSALADIGYYDESLRAAGDWDFALRFLLRYDIEFLDTPDALALYHHRPQSGGANANAVFKDTHKSSTNLIANKYLRQDINEGKLGLGYIMNSLRYNYDKEQQLNQKFEHLANMFRQIDSRMVIIEQLVSQHELRSR